MLTLVASMLSIAPALAGAPSLPAGAVVLGVGTPDGFETEVRVVGPDGRYDVVTTIEHAKGHVPKGALVGDHLVVVHDFLDDSQSGAFVVQIDLATGARTPLGKRALLTQAPALDDAGRVLYVHQERDGVFSVVRAGDAQPLAGGLAASWLTPARGAASSFLEIGAGDGRVVTFDALGVRTVRAELGAGRFRSAAVVGDDVVVERGLAGGRAQVLDVAHGKATVVLEGLAGMDPLPLAPGQLVVGAGTKRAQVLVGRVVRERGSARFVASARLDPHVAGVASPRAAALVGGAPVVVAWIDRGASLPGELWRVRTVSSVRLVEPGALVAVEVYGVTQ